MYISGGGYSFDGHAIGDRDNKKTIHLVLYA
jgi:hypothetical protein